MHTLQKILITRLVQNNGQSFSDLTRGYDAENNIVFHLKRLIFSGFVEKMDNKYFITASGINTLNTFHKVDLQDNTFKMFFVGIVCNCGDEFLIKPHTQSQEAFYNLPSGSPLFAEDLEIALSRIFRDETDIDISYDKFSFDSLHVKTIKTKDDEVLFDDAFAVYRVQINPQQKKSMHLKKGCAWIKKPNIERLPNKWSEIDFCILGKNWEVYKKYTVMCNYVL